MAIQLWGSNGGFQGKNGANIGKWVNGRYEIGPLLHPSHKPPTVAQIDQRYKFALITSWLRRLKSLIKSGYRATDRKSAWNSAVSFNLKNAITGVTPNFEIDYPKAKFTKGDLSPLLSLVAGAQPGGELEVTWTDYLSLGPGSLTDIVNIVVYVPEMDAFIAQSSTRVTKSCAIQLPLDYVDLEAYVYAAAISATGMTASDTQFVATITIL